MLIFFNQFLFQIMHLMFDLFIYFIIIIFFQILHYMWPDQAE